MQEVTASENRTVTIFDQLRNGVLVDGSSKSRAFSDFLGLMSGSGSAVWRQEAATQHTAQDAVAPFAMQAEAAAQVPAAAARHAADTVGQTGGAAIRLADDAAVQIDSRADAHAAIQALGQNGAQATVQAVLQNGAQAATQANAQASVQASAQAATQTAAQAATKGGTQTALNAKLSKAAEAAAAAKNVPVSRQAFEEAKPLLLKAGLSDKDLAELSAQVQAGSLTWGQLVQNLGGRMTGAKKAVNLSDGEAVELQSLFQKMGFAADDAAKMVASVAKGDGLAVLSNIQNKLSTLPDDSSLGLDKGQLATFFKALGLPAATAQALTGALGPESTVADMKNALAAMGQSLAEQRTKTAAADAELAKGLGKIMEKDAAKHTRDATQSVTDSARGSSRAEVAYELKTKAPDDTSWFDQREKNSQEQASQQSPNQQKASDDSWRGFNSKVRADEAAQAQSAAARGQQQAESGKGSLEGLARSGQSAAQPQARAENVQQPKAYEKTAAPRVLEQVTQAMLKDLGQGRKQMTLQLDPENLGKAQVILQVKGKEVSALIQVEDTQAAAMLSANMDSLKKSLEAQGLTVQNLEVQAGLTSRQDQQAFTPDQHNQAQERQELSRLFSQLRMMRSDQDGMAPDMQTMHMRAILADQGLHIVA